MTYQQNCTLPNDLVEQIMMQGLEAVPEWLAKFGKAPFFVFGVKPPVFNKQFKIFSSAGPGPFQGHTRRPEYGSLAVIY